MTRIAPMSARSLASGGEGALFDSQPLELVPDRSAGRKDDVLEALRRRDRRGPRCDPCKPAAEASLRQSGGDLRAEARLRRRLLDRDDALGVQRRGEDPVEFEGRQLRNDAEVGGQLALDEQLPNRLPRQRGAPAVRDYRQFGILEADRAEPSVRVDATGSPRGEVVDESVPRLPPSLRVPGLVLAEKDGAGVRRDRVPEQRVRIDEARGGDDAQSGDAEEHLLEALAVSRAVAAAAAHRDTEDEVHRRSALREVVVLRGAVRELIGREGDEVAEHDLRDRL